MKNFMDSNFLLESEVAKEIYHNYASNMPIIDYHCHINPREIAENKKYENITQVWLYGDHYKWRAMRSCGVAEEYITGNASDYDKFVKWAEILPKLIGNPLYHWTHLELKQYFGYEGTLDGRTAKEVWNLCNAKLIDFSVRDIIECSNVEVICTTDDPIDHLEYHKQIADDSSFATVVLPTFRPDKAVNIELDTFTGYIQKLSEITGIEIADLASLKQALSMRIDYFHSAGCRISDHALQYVMCSAASDDEVGSILGKALNGEGIDAEETEKYKTAMLIYFASEYSKRNWAMQLHYGTIRNINSRMFANLGPDTGYDCISTMESSSGLSRLLNAIDKIGELPKTIVYSLNPNDDVMICSAIGCFQGQGIESKMQHGSAWWYNDTKHGMIKQLENLASVSVLGNFVGMLTDSRSFLSYTRHEYFRRILCNMIGNLTEKGEYPYDKELLKDLVENISYYNAKRYFGF